MRLNRNMQAMRIYDGYRKNLEVQSKSYSAISSGYKINKYMDDPNAKAKSDKLNLEIRGLEMASRNIQDSTSLIQTTDSSMQTITEGLQKIRELLVQAGGNNGDGDKLVIQNEIDEMINHITYTANSSTMNGVKMLNEDNGSRDTVSLLIGITSESIVELPTYNLTAEGLGLVDSNGVSQISTSDIGGGLAKIDQTIDMVSAARNKYGAICVRMESTYDSSEAMIIRVQGAEASITGADIALEMVEYSKNSLLVESGLSMMAQANQLPQEILQILRDI